MDFPWLMQRQLSWVYSLMFFQAKVSRPFTQMFRVKWVGYTLLYIISEEGL